MSWLEEIREANGRFKEKIDIDVLPTERQPCPYAVVTCMDPRVNLESAGIQPFKLNGELKSQVRVIRTIGGMAENRSLIVGIHLAGFKEIAVIMHTDCGCSLAYHKIDRIPEIIDSPSIVVLIVTTNPHHTIRQAIFITPFRHQVHIVVGAIYNMSNPL